MKKPYTLLITELDNQKIQPKIVERKHWGTEKAAHTYIKDYNSHLAEKSKGKIASITKYEIIKWRKRK